MSRRSPLPLVAAAILLIAVVPEGAAAKTVRVTMEATAFVPSQVDARVGDTVVWTNRDIVDHTATARDGSFNLVVRSGRSARIVIGKAGSIDYRCRYHPNMDARIVVKP